MKQLIARRGVWLVALTTLLLLPFELAYANRKARIVKVVKCQASIKGGEFSTGDKAVFIALNKGKRVEIPIKIESVLSGKRYRGEITEASLCGVAKGAKYSPAASDENLKDIFVYRQSAFFGILNTSHSGLNVILGDGEQNLPSLITAKTELGLFPLASGEGFFERNVGFVAGIESSLPVLGAWAVDDGGAIDASWFEYFGGVVVRPFFIGAEHPTSLLFKYVGSSYDFKQSKQAVYKKSVLRSVSCGNFEVGFKQVFGVTSSLGIFAEGRYALAGTCESPAITESEALSFEKEQIAAGRQKQNVLAATKIESSAPLQEAKTFGYSAGFRYEVLELAGLNLDFSQTFFTANLQLIDSQRKLQVNSTSIHAGVDVTFGD